MISGFNTDIKVGNTVYHVQTEDKGLKSRLILSLVYDKGTILASKRVTYDDLANGAFDEKELAERVNRQHQLICAAVRAGRINELKEMTGKERAKTAKAVISEPKPAVPPSIPVAKVGASKFPEVTALNVETARIAASKPYALEPVIEAVAIIEEEIVLEAGAVAVVSEFSGQERPTHSKLSLELLGESKFKGGDRRTVNIMVCRGTERKVVAGAEIMLKVLGSSFRPVIFHAKSDANGLAKIHMQLPHFEAGRAALLIRAIAAGEEIELRRVVTPG